MREFDATLRCGYERTERYYGDNPTMKHKVSIQMCLVSTILLILLTVGCPLKNPTGSDDIENGFTFTVIPDGRIFSKGDTVEISIDISDEIQNIDYIAFLIDGGTRQQNTEPPFHFTWRTAYESAGDHTISVIVGLGGIELTLEEIVVELTYRYIVPENSGDGWETATLESVGIDPTLILSLMNILSGQNHHLVHGILIARNGRLIMDEYFPGYRRDDQNNLVFFNSGVIHDQASATKSFTSALLGIAIEHGFIESIYQPVHDFFPEIDWGTDDPRREITLEHMITMSSGIQWDQAAYAPLDPRNDLILFATSTDPWQMYLSRPLVHNPGSHMEYSEASINVVGECIRRSSGLRLDEFAQSFLFDRLGITDRYWNVKQDGWVWASGDLFIRPRDMLKFGQLYLQDGAWNGEQVIPTEWVDKASEPFHTFDQYSNFHERHLMTTHAMTGYSYAWWTLDSQIYGEIAYSATGWGEQRIIVLPEYDMVVVFTGGSQWDDPYLTSHQMMTRYILPSIR